MRQRYTELGAVEAAVELGRPAAERLDPVRQPGGQAASQSTAAGAEVVLLSTPDEGGSSPALGELR
ncbi:MAG TPA: hypothetical protein VLW50_33590 [Streptosporangiaceae bacterium]|nr:hypothetical protein [Streptosporangiaceae bacterium]